MIEKKSFFTENNHLNKGYKAQGKVSSSSKRTQNIDLPESSILAAYEEIAPGTIAHIVEMAKKEQEHRHRLEALQMRMEKTALRVGRIFGIFLLLAVCYTSFSLYLHDLTIQASVFAVIGFMVLALPMWIVNCRKGRKIEKSHIAPARSEANKNVSGERVSNIESKGYTQSSKPQRYHRRRKRI